MGGGYHQILTPSAIIADPDSHITMFVVFTHLIDVSCANLHRFGCNVVPLSFKPVEIAVILIVVIVTLRQRAT